MAIFRGTVQDLRDYLDRLSNTDAVVLTSDISGTGGTPTPGKAPPGGGIPDYIKDPYSATDHAEGSGLNNHAEAHGKAALGTELVHGTGRILLHTSPTWFKRKILSILKDNAISRTVSNKLYGYLDFKRLYKVTTTPRIFCKDEKAGKKKYNVCIVVDSSGSMAGAKQQIAVESMLSLIQDFQNDIALEVMFFSCSSYIFKKYDEIIPVKDLHTKCITKLNDFMCSSGGGNHDAVALKQATKSLLKRDGKKILIMLSDGQPSCGGGYPDCTDDCYHDKQGKEALRKQVQATEHTGITLLSIGICSDSVTHYYKHSIVIKAATDLYGALATYMGRYVKRTAVTV